MVPTRARMTVAPGDTDVIVAELPLPTTLANALAIQAFHGLQAPVYAGCDRPLAQPHLPKGLKTQSLAS